MAERHILLARAARMRREPTEPEKRLWRYLSNSQPAGLKFRRQATIGQRIVDFLCPAKALVIEVDGATHDRESDLEMDSNLLAHLGYKTLRVTNEDIMSNIDGVLRVILETAISLPDRWEGVA